jgi:DNA-binding MarR family transcriptional regulator
MSEAATTGSLVWRLAMKWRTAVDRAVGPFGLTHAQYVLLATLYGMYLAGARPSQRELADSTALEPVYVSRLARALEDAGLIDRAASAADPRAVELGLTPRGEEVVVQAIAAVRQLHDALLEPIGGPRSVENRRFRSALRALLREPLNGESRA